MSHWEVLGMVFEGVGFRKPDLTHIHLATATLVVEHRGDVIEVVVIVLIHVDADSILQQLNSSLLASPVWELDLAI